MTRRLPLLALSAASLLALAGCSTATADGGASGSSASDDGTVQVVASTNVYGDLAATVGGDRVEVTSIIDSAAKDPHGYAASARDRLAVQQADLVIENGGGYDAFMDELLEGSSADVVIASEHAPGFADADADADAEEAEGEGEAEGDAGTDEHDAHIEGFNEHVWFDVHTIIDVVEQIAADLAEIDPAGAADYEANAATLIADLDAIEAEQEELHTALEGTPVIITEPLPGPLAAAVGLDDVTPDGFASAVEEGNDVAPAILLDALTLLEDGDADAVLSNAQTGGAETDRVEQAATDAGIPVIGFTELLAPDQSYAEWMRAAISDLAAALDE